MHCPWCQATPPNEARQVHLLATAHEGLQITRHWCDGTKTYLNGWNCRPMEGEMF